MFEDTQNGDYDYNDLIIHVKHQTDLPWAKEESLETIEIQPIALGSTKTIKLGCILSDGSTHMISDDVRTDLFGGRQDSSIRSMTMTRYVTNWLQPI